MRENLNWDRSTDWPWQIAKRIFSNLFVINWTEQLQYLWSGCPRVSIPDEWPHRSCLFGERRNFDHSLSGESGKSWRKIQSFTTHDSTSSKWSRFFLDECPNASSHLREDTDRRWSAFDELWSWASDFSNRMSSRVKCLLRALLAFRFVLVYFSSWGFIWCFVVKDFDLKETLEIAWWMLFYIHRILWIQFFFFLL